MKDKDLSGVQFNLNILENPYRAKIFLLCQKEELKISKLQEYLGTSYNTVWNHVKTLEESGFVKTRTAVKERGKPVYVKSVLQKIKIEIDLLEMAKNVIKGSKTYDVKAWIK